MEAIGPSPSDRPLIVFINFDTCVIDIDSEVLNELNSVGGSQETNASPSGKSRVKGESKSAKRAGNSSASTQMPIKRTRRALMDEFDSDKIKLRISRIMREEPGVVSRAKPFKDCIAALHEMKHFGVAVYLITSADLISHKLEWIAK
eukprot:TRINITY_DN4111_c0_g1_i1.p2 TRINITY_DN4111_c0_g1~~TRINITY_DN4111_c0_g1_i1.p2  ORF type:complete len:147 (+),score=25.06 TRINITY_DN4111_c0_g1_i1:89-529(+)